MKRKMVYAGGSWTAGMFFASVVSPDMQIPALLTVLLVSAFFFRKTLGKFIYFAVSAVFFIAGMLVFTLSSSLTYDSIRSYAGEEIFFEGKITGITDYTDEKSRYRVHGMINSETAADIICFVNTIDCECSDEISFRCTPSAFENTFLFSTKDYYESQGCFLQTNSLYDVTVKKNERFSAVRLISHYREYAAERISSILPGEYGALITAMLSGDKSGLDESSKKELYRSGTGHMMAVSGMHLVLVVSLISAAAEKAGISGRRKFILMETAIAVFVIFSGASVSVLRAALMMTLICSASLFGRKPDPLNSLCIASFVLLCIHPYLIRNSSFLLSVAGTYGASVIVPYITEDIPDEGIFNSLRKKITSVFCISVCVFPFSVMFFDEASVVSPIADIVLIPLCTFSLMCGVGAALTGFADVTAYPLLMAGGLSSKAVLRISSFLADSGLSAVSLRRGYVPLLTLFLAVFVVFTALHFRNSRSVLTSMVISVAVFISASVLSGFINRNVLTVYRTGNEKSAAVVVSMGRYTDVIDITGNSKTSQYVSKLTDMCGMHRIESVSFMKNPYQSMASFSKRLVLNDVSHVYVPQDTYTAYGTDVCGCEPEHFGEDGIFLDRGKYTVRASSDGTVTVEYGGTILTADISGIDTGEKYFTQKNIAVKKSASGEIKVWNLE